MSRSRHAAPAMPFLTEKKVLTTESRRETSADVQLEQAPLKTLQEARRKEEKEDLLKYEESGQEVVTSWQRKEVVTSLATTVGEYLSYED